MNNDDMMMNDQIQWMNKWWMNEWWWMIDQWMMMNDE